MIKQVLTFSDNIHHVHATTAGLWIGHQGGVSFLDPRNGAFSKWTTGDGLPAHPVLHVASDGERIAVATPNGVAWCGDARALLRDAGSEPRKVRWERGLMHPLGQGAYVNGVSFVNGKLYAATGGGRVYLEGAAGFELLELPLRQARLVRIQPLPSPKKTLRLVFVTNNSGILLLATGGNDEPSLYQWGEDEGLCSRYVTALATAGDWVAVAVHGCVHVAPQRELVERPEELSRWGRVNLSDLMGPAEHNRIPALCEHAGSLYAGTSVGLYRIALSELENVMEEPVLAERVDDSPVRQLASFHGELWVVQNTGLGHYLEASAVPVGRGVETQEAEPRQMGLRTRIFGGRLGGGRTPEPLAPPPVQSMGGWRRWRFVPEPRWRGFNAEPECRQVLAISASSEGLGIGGEAGRVALRVRERWMTEIVARLRRPPEIHSLAYDPDNASYWAATRYGLYQRDERGRWHRDLLFPGRTVHALCVWGGSVVALGSAGLHMFVQSEWSEIAFPDEVPALFSAAVGEDVLALAGRPGGGFFLWRSGTQRPEPVSIPVGRANCMAWGQNGELWLGADRGLTRWDGTRADTFQWNDERRDHVTSVLVHDGRLYVGSQSGVWIAPARKLKPASGEALESQGQRMGLLEGLPDANVTCMAVQSSQVLIGTQGGLAVLD